jgi:hypothetical protein
MGRDAGTINNPLPVSDFTDRNIDNWVSILLQLSHIGETRAQARLFSS